MTHLEFKQLFDTLKALPAVQTFTNQIEKQSYKIVRYKDEDYLISIFDPNNKPYCEDQIYIGYLSKEKKNWDQFQIELNQEEVFIVHSEDKRAYMIKFNDNYISANPYVHGLLMGGKEFEVLANKKLLKAKIAKLV